MKNRRTEWRGGPLSYRSRSRISPLMRDKRKHRAEKRSFRSSGLSRASERQLHVRRSDHGKEVVQEHSLPIHHWSHNHHPSLSPRDDGFRFHQGHIFPVNRSSSPNWRLSQSTENRDFYSQMNEALPSPYVNIEGQQMLPQKSTFIDEEASQQLYSDRPMDSTLLHSDRLRTSGHGVGMGIQDNGIYSRDDRHRDPYDGSIGMGMQDNKIHSYGDRHRDQYDHMDRKQIYSKDLSFPKMPPPSSTILNEEFEGLHHDQVSDGLSTGICRYPNDSMEHYPYHKVPQSYTLRHDPPEVYGYDELRRRGLEDHRQRDELCKNLPHPSRMKACSSTFMKYNEDRMDKAVSPGRNLIERNFSDLHDDELCKNLPHPSRMKASSSAFLKYNEDRMDKAVSPGRNLIERTFSEHHEDELCKNLPHPFRMKSNSSTFLKYNEDRMDKAVSPGRNLFERTFSDHHESLYQDFSHDCRDVGAQRKLPTKSDNWYGSLRIKSSRDFRTMPFEEGFASEKEYFPLPYRADHRNGRSLLSDRDLDEQRLAVSSHDQSHIDDLSDHNIERMGRRSYAISGDKDESELGVVFVNGRHSSAPYGGEEMWLTEEPMGPSHSKSMLSAHSRYRKFSHSISTLDAFMPSHGVSSVHAENDHKVNLKRRMKHIPSDFRTSSSSEREDLLRPYKHLKRGMHSRLGAQGGTNKSASHFGKNDPREDSEEFKQQVHKAFLRYSKLLNESPHNHRIYQNQGNACKMLCSVCGSSSKEFVDTNSLVIHTYHSLKVGLKTEHLGFHKALCVLLGWNWRVPPDNSRAYQSIPADEAKAMREDLILWPPLVIIHDGLVRGNSTKDAKVVTVEGMEKILRDMGFGTGMTRVSLSKPANQTIFIAKFTPTFSGLQEAQRLHNHFSDKKHGKQELRQAVPTGHAEEGDAVLYGYMAAAEDLDKVDHETRKRSVVKSRKDIQAIADAPLNAD